MTKYEFIVTALVIIEAIVIFLLFKKKTSSQLVKLKTERDSALKAIDDNLKQINKLEEEKRIAKNEANKINTANDALKFLKSFGTNK